MAGEMYAFSRLEGAFGRTKNLLWPLDWGVWLRLAVIALFVGSGISMPNTFQYQFDESDLAAGSISGIPDISGVALATVMLGIIAAVLAIGILWMFIGATMRFVFVDMLSTGDIHIRRFFGKRIGKGVRLFLFEIALIVIMLLAVVAFGFMLTGYAGATTLFALIALIPLVLVVAILFGLILLLTTDFVVPIMVSRDCGIIEGWRQLIGAITSHLWQTIVYVITRFVLGLVATIAQTLLVIIAMVVIAIPFALIGIVLLAVLQVPNLTLLLALAIPYLIIAIPVALLIAVPFITFFRYYALLVLEGLRPEYRLLPE
ncbi:MAG: hypothetical protein GX885_04330 [Methanomicrobiales archaeon]|nr:hypothetical protein [Methanomicrobiales archaeon]